MLSTSILEVRKSNFGKGLFAKKHIAADTVLCDITGPFLTFQQTLQLGAKESHSIQVDNDKYILCDPPFLYSNHSCTPNSALNSHLQLFALRDINKDEELLWDYSTSMLERHWTMQCACGSSLCRKIITDFDLLPQNVQHFYLEKNIVLPYIVTNIQSFSKAHMNRA
jgi:uncharacterized protein